MASPMSSASEGEIVETTHKANTASDHVREPTIDDSSRAFGADGASDMSYHGRSFSRSPSPYRNKPERSPSPYRHSRNDNRSPSPFRHDRDGRGRDSRPPHSHKRKASPHRYGRPEKRYNSDRGGHQSRRHDESRIAPRHSSSLRDRENGPDRTHGHRLSYADNEQPPAVPKFSELSTNGRPHHSNDGRHWSKRDDAPHTSRLHTPNSTPSAHDANRGTVHPPTSAQTSDSGMIEEADTRSDSLSVSDNVPSQESREEKKRRWAAKRAQHAAEKTNLLHQAVLANASETTTPNVASPIASSTTSVSPPATPQGLGPYSAPASPEVMVVDKQESTGAGASPLTDGPSAANYDPTQDMLDDRARAEQRAQQSEMSASAYDETNPRMLSTLPPEKSQPAKKKKKELDMFAFSDDEGDDEAENEADEHDGPVKGTVLDASLLDNWDDQDGYYKIISNELVNAGRYRMIKGLGRGVFANVAQAEDVQDSSGQLVAIKIVRRNDAMRKASQKEMDFLQRLNDTDPQDKRHIIRLLGSFDHKGHFCIVFEHMSKNLRDLLKEETSGHGLSLQAVKTYARQMFSGLKHLEDCQIIHADLKPDNILVSLDKKTVKLCDLGTAADKRDNNEPTPYLVSRFYRAPEIILGMDIGYGVDMWAIGCTIYELWTGKILFPGRSNNQMIKVFMECLGWPSEKLLRKGQLSGQHFEPGPPLKFISREVDRFNHPIVRKIEPHRLASHNLKTRVQDATRGIASNGPSPTELNDFAELLSSCLHWNFEKRLRPKEAMAHKFFVGKTLAPRAAVIKPAMPKRGGPAGRR